MTRNRHLAGFFFLALMLVAMIGGCGKSDPTVAVIGDEKIKLSELKSSMVESRPNSKWEQYDETQVREHLDFMVDDKLLYLGAKTAKIDETPEFMQEFEPRYQNIMLRALYQRQVFDYVIPPKDIQDFYNRTKKRVYFRDILFKLPTNPSEAESDSVYNEAMTIYKRLKSGEEYGFLARQFSAHTSSAANDGKVGFVEWNTDRDNIRHKMWELDEGEYSKPLKNNSGYHILMVDDIQSVEVQPFEKEKEKIRNLLMRERRSKIDERAKEYWEDLRKKYEVHIIDSLIVEWQEYFGSMSSECTIVLDSLKALPKEKREKVIATSKDLDLTIDVLTERIALAPPNTDLRLDNRAIVIEFFERKMQIYYLTKEAELQGLDKDKDVQREINGYKATIMTSDFSDNVIYGEIDMDETLVRQFYDANKDEHYKNTERRKMQEIMIRDKALAESVARQARSGSNFDKLAAKYTERPNHKLTEGRVTWFAKGAWGEVGDEAYTMKKGELRGPIWMEKDQAYSIIKLTDIRPEGYKPMEEIKERVQRDYVNKVKAERKRKWLDQAREDYDVQIADEVVANAVGVE